MAKNLYFENYPGGSVVKQAKQLITKLPIVLSGTSANLTVGGTLAVTGTQTFTGNTTVSGNLVVTGTSTQSGAVTQKANLVSGSGATVTLTAAQSGSAILFDRAAGIVYTLPAPAVGMYFDFHVVTTITSNNAKVITDAGSTFIMGDMTVHKDSDGTQLGVFADGAANRAITMNGTTTGGILGTWLRFVCVTATQWNVSGFIHASGAIATPVANS